MKAKFRLSVFALGASLVAASGSINGADNTTTSTMDSAFATKAAAGGIAEVKLGQLALKNGSSEEVKKFAQKMIDDHSKAGDKLKDVASKDHISLPSDVGSKDRLTYNRLAKLKGADFDRAYMSEMVQDHKGDVAEFQREANGGRNPDLKNFASESLPTLNEHFKMAEDIAGKVK